MRTPCMLVGLTLAATTAVTGQTPSPRIGVTAGLNQSHVVGPDVSQASTHSAGMFGVYVVAPLSRAWSLQAGTLFSMKGWEMHDAATQDFAVVHLSYLEMPLLLRYDAALNDKTGVFFYGGPGLGLRTECSISATDHATGRSQSATCKEVSDENGGEFAFNRVDAGAIGGAGFRIGLGRAQLVFTGQYEYGFTKIFRPGDAKNRAATFGLGLEIPIRGK